ncbi:CocE/NonD family hydrolase [Cryobacterium roopkundense]|uniref:Xaa-Pro dipeptidyl-peptidase-like domain-containing protein n=2 Tax=Cryobacterium roopkundense TaxID=1001240 RepID=A0A7W8ZVJ2_9MICO|nr:CocE/NonD family hydrolase [Cryobacterium roopkundense]MBB5640700.1 hypothetical protein [Cryobacterium roopkundense]
MRRFAVQAPDGVTLSGFVAEAAEPRGTVVIRTPYDCEVHTAQARSWQARGYTCLVADVRGRYASAGHWHPYSSEGADGAATVRAVLNSTWHRGGITLLGSSYAAHCALETARALAGVPEHSARIDAVVALVPALGRFETARDPNGCPRLADRFGWWFEHGFERRSGPPLGERRATDLLARAVDAGPEATHPLEDPTAGQADLWRELWAAGPTDLHARYAGATSPLLVVTGAQDFFILEALDLHDSWPAPVSLINGPWGHRLTAERPDPAGSIGERVLAWMQRPSTPYHPAHFVSRTP